MPRGGVVGQSGRAPRAPVKQKVKYVKYVSNTCQICQIRVKFCLRFFGPSVKLDPRRQSVKTDPDAIPSVKPSKPIRARSPLSNRRACCQIAERAVKPQEIVIKSFMGPRTVVLTLIGRGFLEKMRYQLAPQAWGRGSHFSVSSLAFGVIARDRPKVAVTLIDRGRAIESLRASITRLRCGTAP